MDDSASPSLPAAPELLVLVEAFFQGRDDQTDPAVVALDLRFPMVGVEDMLDFALLVRKKWLGRGFHLKVR